MKRTSLIIFALLVLVAALAWAQGPLAPTYMIQPGDTVAVSVFNHDEYSLSETPVGLDGFISMPVIGPVSVSGLTSTEASAKISELLSEYLRNPLVSVHIGKTNLYVYVLGEVRGPGPKTWFTASSVRQAIAESGGFTDIANRTEATLLKPDGTRSLLDLTTILSGEASADVELVSGDIVIVNRMRGISILGEFAKTGTEYVPGPVTVSEVIARSGGFSDQADLDNLAILRGGKLVKRFAWKLGQPNLEQDVVLQDGDMLYAPARLNVASVFGQSNRSGSFPITQDMKVSQLLAVAGGLAPTADPTRLILTRSSGEAVPVDYEALVERGDKSLDVAVLPGDVLFVPERINSVFLLGEAAKPGAFSWLKGLTVLNLVSLAGGPTDQANLREAKLLRGGSQELPLDLFALVKEGSVAGNVPLEPGDVLLIPRQVLRFAVLGGVSKPGVYMFQEGDTILDGFAQSGGPRDNEARLDEAWLIRVNENEPDGLEYIPLNLADIIKEGKGPLNLELKPHDVIYVPSRPATTLRSLMKDISPFYWLFR